MALDFYEFRGEVHDRPFFALPRRVDMDVKGTEASKGDDDETHHTCMACRSKAEAHNMTFLRCGDWWCAECLEHRFKLSLKDETMYPPQCCHYHVITLKEVERWLSKSLIREFQSKQLELRTKNKTYCHRSTCSAFIAPHSIHNYEAICQKCSARTCGKCKGKWHFGPCSAGDNADFMEFAKLNTWKRCPQCKRMVEKNDGKILATIMQSETLLIASTGCNHMM
jgi:hypothetical protein